MPTVEPRAGGAFAIWITGLPASGKSTLAGALKAELAARGCRVAVLESDALREIFTPHPRYDDAERETFYRQMTYVGALLTDHGIPVIFDATANRRSHRDDARRRIPGFLEVYVDTPLETCMARDPKGLYRAGHERSTATLPGLQAAYEPPENPDVVVHGGEEAPAAAAQRVVRKLAEKGYI